MLPCHHARSSLRKYPTELHGTNFLVIHLQVRAQLQRFLDETDYLYPFQSCSGLVWGLALVDDLRRDLDKGSVIPIDPPSCLSGLQYRLPCYPSGVSQVQSGAGFALSFLDRPLKVVLRDFCSIPWPLRSLRVSSCLTHFLTSTLNHMVYGHHITMQIYHLISRRK